MQNVKEQSVVAKDNCTERLTEQALPSALYRLVEEKQELDERIIKLNAFLADDRKATRSAGYPQVGLMDRQLEVKLEYSSILNARILRWKK